MQVKGRAELVDHGDVLDTDHQKLKAISEQLQLPPVKYVVRLSALVALRAAAP